MSDIPLTIAEPGQAALTAHAIEPTAGGAGDIRAAPDSSGEGHTHEAACLNCATPLVGSHCHACGQAAHVHRTIGAFFHDLAHGVFHIEGKVWRTLPLLAWHPGRLTREYIDGRRASYVSPIALFLFAVFLMFSVMHLTEGGGGREIESGAAASKSIDDAIVTQRKVLNQLTRDRATASDPAARSRIDRRIADTQRTIAAIRSLGGERRGTTAGIEGDDWRADLPEVAHVVDTFRANPELALYKLETTAYKYSWLLIPISVPLLWLLFPFDRRFQLYDHTVFVTYSLTFVTLLAVVYMLGKTIGLPLLGMLIVVVPPLHMYRQLRGTYAIGVAGALWRTAVLGVFAVLALMLFALLLLSVELTG